MECLLRPQKTIFVIAGFLLVQAFGSTNSGNQLRIVDDHDPGTTPNGPHPPTPPHQLNCTDNPSLCTELCEGSKPLQYSSTFCNPSTGSCVCDCRDSLKSECVQTTFTPCFQDCVKANPNPDAFLYKGGNCPISIKNSSLISYQCACECTVRDDYYETNDIF